MNYIDESVASNKPYSIALSLGEVNAVTTEC
jgi:hypothetical protein